MSEFDAGYQAFRAHCLFIRTNPVDAYSVALPVNAPAPLSAFGDAEQSIVDQIVAGYQSLYYASQTARDAMDAVVAGGKNFFIGSSLAGSQWMAPSNIIAINITEVNAFQWFNSKGELVQGHPELVYIHELIHAAYGVYDAVLPSAYINGNLVPGADENLDKYLNSQNYDYKGPVVRKVNAITQEVAALHGLDRASYLATASLGDRATAALSAMSNQPVNGSYTDGNEIDVARFGDIYLPGVANTIDQRQNADSNRSDPGGTVAVPNTRDLIFGFAGQDVIFAGKGNDWVYGGDEVIESGHPNAGNDAPGDVIDGGDGDDHLFGGRGNDFLRSGNGDVDYLIGGGGDDVLNANGGAISIFAGAQSIVHMYGKDKPAPGGSTARERTDGDHDTFMMGGGLTYIHDADFDDTIQFGAARIVSGADGSGPIVVEGAAMRLTGGVAQFWSESGVASWSLFGAFISAVPILTGNLMFGILFSFVDGPAISMFSYGRNNANQMVGAIGLGRLGAFVVDNYDQDFDTNESSGGLFVFQQAIAKAGATFVQLKSYLNAALAQATGTHMEWTDPLILDLDGDGLELTAAPTTYFDVNADGWAERTVWTRGGDGFLVRDVNANGQIDNITEMFGNATTSGLSALGVLDSNNDGKITAADTGFADLRVWVDANGDAITDAGELKTLASLNITEISLTPTGVTGNVRGNTIAAQSTFTRGDGSTGTVADVNLITNFVDTQWLGDKTISGTAAALPELKAFGRLTDLRVAMTDDATLLSSVTTFKNLSASTSWTSLQTSAADILYRWAGVDGVTATAITANFDRKMLAFLETYYGTQLTPRDGSGNPDSNNAEQLRASWDFILGSETIRLAAQGPLSTLLGNATYELSSDRLISPSATTLADSLRSVLTGLSSDPATALAAWNSNWAPIFTAFTGALVRADQNLVKTDYTVQSLIRAMDGLTQPLTLNQLVAGLGLANVNIGTSGVDALVRSGPPTDSAVFVGGAGNDTYTGDGGQAVYVYGTSFGQDTINDLDNKEYGDRIRFSLHSQSDVTFTRSGNDLIISVNASTDKVTIKNQFLRGQFGSNYGVEEVQFADGTLLDMPHLMQIIGKGTSASELLTGSALDDVLEGLGGNDTLRGGDGGDLYFYSAGHGQDVIEEIQTTPMNQAMDVLGIEDGHGMGDIQFARTGESDDLQITFASSTDSILVKGQFWYSSLGVKGSTSPEGLVGLLLSAGAPFFDGAKLATESRIEQIVFKSGGVLDWMSIQQILIDQATTSGNDATYGFGSIDYLKSSAGNDTLVGRDGGDTYEFGRGSGNDTIWDQARYITLLGTDTVKFGAGLTLSDLTFSRPTDAPDLVITIIDTGETLTIKDQFAGQKLSLIDMPGFGINWFSRIEQFKFESGSSITWEDVLHSVTTGTSGVDRLNGDWYADTLDGGAGNDHLNGRDDGDIYLFGIGDGQDVIEETRTWVIDTAPDILQLKSNVAFADTSFHRVGETDDLIVSFSGTTDQVLIKGQYQVAETGPFGAQAFYQIEQFKWADGTTRNWTQLTQQIIDATTTSGADVVVGTHFADRFNASAGADTLKGGNGSDTYVFGIGSGADVVNDLAYNILADNVDTIEFGAGVLPSDIIIERSGANDVVLKITGTTDQLTIQGQFAYTSLNIREREIERFTFANGTIWNAADLRTKYLAQASTSAANLIEGFWSNDAINGLGGNDTLRGGDGSDTYTFAGAFGQDRIEESVGNVFYNDADAIVFGSGLISTNAILTRSGDDLTIGFSGVSDTVTIAGQFAHTAFYSGWEDVESVTFADSVTWTDAQIRTLLLSQAATSGAETITGFYTNDTLDGLAGNDTLRGAGGGDTYVFGKGSGQDRIEETYATVYEDQPDTVSFAANTTRVEVTFSRVGDNLVAAITGVSDTLTIKDHFITNTARVEFFKFADGTTMTAAQAETNAIASQSTSGADTINGSSGDDIIDGGAGNDALNGGQGNDTYVFGRGYGQDALNETNFSTPSTNDRVVFKEGISQADLILTRSGNNLIIQIAGTSDQLTISNQFYTWVPPVVGPPEAGELSPYRIDSFVFADGANLSAADMELRTLVASQTAGNDIVTGYAWDEVLDGGAGNDTLRGGPAGNDTYVFGRGYGQDSIEEDSYTSGDLGDAVRFKPDVAPNDLVFSRSGNNLIIQISGTSDQLTIQNQLWVQNSSDSFGYNRIENFYFADGTIWTALDIDKKLLTGKSGADTLTGFENADTLDGGAGNDTLSGGQSGNDLYIFGRGYGQDVVNEDSYSSGDTNDTLLFNADVAPEDIELQRSGNNLIIKIIGTTDQITIANQHWSQDATDIYSYNRIENFVFADGTAWSALDIDLRLLSESATSGNDEVRGYDKTDVLDGGAGNDTLRGYRGNDVYLFKRGSGQDLIDESNSGNGDLGDTLTFGEGIGLNDVHFARVGNDLVVQIVGTTDQITIKEQLWVRSSNDIYGVNRIENFVFADGSELSAFEVEERVLAEATTASGDVINGYESSDLIYGGPGGDTLSGAAGADTLLGGDGNDLLTGGAGADSLDGGAGIDSASYSAASALILDRATPSNSTGDAAGDVFIGIEKFVLTGGADRFVGTADNEIIDGGYGADTMIGGAGDDVYFTDNAGDVVTELASGGNDTVMTMSSTYNIASNPNIENVTYIPNGNGASFAFTGTGDGNANIITGGVWGDTLDGGAGADTLIGGGQNDIYYIDNVGDVVVENSGEGTDTIRTGLASFTLSAWVNVENIIYTGAADFFGVGNSGANALTAAGGNDRLDGGSGADALTGGLGNDTYVVDNASDVVSESASAGTDTIETTLGVYSISSLTNVENLTSTGSGSFQGTGNSGANVITGGGGADSLDGGGGADTLIGGLGDDVYTIDNAGDVVTETAGAGTDTIRTSFTTHSLASLPDVENLTFTSFGNFVGTGNAAANVLTGGGSADTLDGGAGADTLIGAGGNDTYIVDNAGDVVTEIAGGGADTVQTALASYNLAVSAANVENLSFTGSGAFTGTGDANANTITGGASADTLDGGTGTDTLVGGLGNDTYIVDTTTDTITEAASAGTDTVQSSVTYTIASLANLENVTLTGANAINATGNASANVLTGNTGANSLDGGSGTDTLIGGTGDDTYIVDTTTDTITEAASAGTDTIQSSVTFTIASLANIENVTLSGTGANSATGNSGANVLTGNSGNNTLTGNDGNDTLSGGAGTDTLVGGIGNDIYIVDTTTDTITEAASAGTDTIQSSVTFTIAALTNVENVTLTASGAISATGNASANVLTGGSGNNTLTGNDGADTLDGGAGTDTLVGGIGNDIYIVDSTTDTITEAASAGTDTVQSSVTFTLASLANVENVTLTSTANINATGNASANNLTGNAGNNTLDGAAGTDTLVGGLGDDIYVVDSTTDTITEAASAGTDTIQSSVTFTIASLANLENVTLTAAGAINATGNSGANVLTGGSGNNTLTGNDGADTLDGAAGTDTLVGGIGNDLYIVDSTTDTITEAASAGTDTIQSSVTFTIASLANLENVTLTGSGAVNATGNAGANVLTGNSGNNTLTSSDGADTLDGGAGTDTMVGGIGNDLYIVDSTTDTITEAASAGTDTIQSSVTYTIASLANLENVTLTGTGTINATGNAAANVLTGNDGANILAGGAGNDTLAGGLANDVAVFAGDMATYSIVTNSGSFSIVDNDAVADGNDGSDTLSAIEQAQFKDQTTNLSAPIVLDLNSDGVNLIDRVSSHALFDWNGDGLTDKTGWISSGDGLLALDRNADGVLSGAKELTFIDDVKGARSDLEGLRAWDSNGDMTLSLQDEYFSRFYVFQDVNGDGAVQTGDWKTLNDLGIASISLQGIATSQTWAISANIVINHGSFTKTDGTTHAMADVAFNYQATQLNGAAGDKPAAAVTPHETSTTATDASAAKPSGDSGTPFRLRDVPGLQDWRMGPIDLDEARDRLTKAGKASNGARVGGGGSQPDAAAATFATSLGAAHASGRGALKDLGMESKVLRMVESMSSFGAKGAADLLLTDSKTLDPKVRELLTSLPDARVG